MDHNNTNNNVYGNHTPIRHDSPYSEVGPNHSESILPGLSTKPHALTPSKTAAPVVTQWLKENYEEANDSSLPRRTVYSHYCQFCSQMFLQCINAASFGKLIRSVFPHLKTRRLGTRGHSKYHYYGIRIKPSSDLSLDVPETTNRKSKKRKLPDSEAPPSPTNTNNNTSAGPPAFNMNNSIPRTPTHQVVQIQLPDFHPPEAHKLPPDVSHEHCRTLMSMYRTHCQRLLDTVAKLQFGEIENMLARFWQGMPPHYRNVIRCNVVIDAIEEKDNLVASYMNQVLLPDVLHPLPVTIPQSIREFARHYESWVAAALKGHPQGLIEKSVNVASAFSQALRKQASLNHLAQATRLILQNPAQTAQMLQDWEGIDFDAIQHQSSWVSLQFSKDDSSGENSQPSSPVSSSSKFGGLLDDHGEIVLSGMSFATLKIRELFKQFLEERYCVEQWVSWLHDMAEQLTKSCVDLKTLRIVCQQLLLKWSFYSSLIIRDLTIRNASSFGSFHLLRTLFDEYLSFWVEQKVNSSFNSNSSPDNNNSSSSSTSNGSSSSSSSSSNNRDNNNSSSIGSLGYRFSFSSLGNLSGGNKNNLPLSQPPPPPQSPLAAFLERPMAHKSPFQEGENERFGPARTAYLSPNPSSSPSVPGGGGGTGSFTSGLLSGGSFARMPSAGGFGSVSDDFGKDSLRKPSFGSFGSFSTEFSRSLFRNSFDRGSLQPLFDPQGSIGGFSVPYSVQQNQPGSQGHNTQSQQDMMESSVEKYS